MVCAPLLPTAFSMRMLYQSIEVSNPSTKLGEYTKPNVLFVEVSGLRFGLPPVVRKPCEFTFLNPAGTPAAVQLACTRDAYTGLSIEHGSSIVGRPVAWAWDNSLVDGAREPLPQLPRASKTSL